jgi:hypothetical protein
MTSGVALGARVVRPSRGGRVSRSGEISGKLNKVKKFYFFAPNKF